jgi:hypothetical protein
MDPHHQQPDVNYIQVLEKVDFPCTVNAQHLPFKGNQLRAETGQIVHFWLLVAPEGLFGRKLHRVLPTSTLPRALSPVL